MFYELSRQGVPPIRLHDLADAGVGGGVEMKVVQRMLRLSSITIASDTYTPVLPQVSSAAAEATAAIIPRQPARSLGLANDHNGQSRTGRKPSRKPKSPGR
ncbi:hypothetical protein [Amycolatopsis sp. GA6-003]|uniref:hypothetical protein n=1 Tax=Amycolatopsis sp. GA6-003 TaxID=2652444 RepID=UPI0039172493